MIIVVTKNTNSPKPIHNNFYPEISIIKEDINMMAWGKLNPHLLPIIHHHTRRELTKL
jgi:hypothetical protein